MKKLFLTVVTILFCVFSYSQEYFLNLITKKNKTEFYKDTIMTGFLKIQNLDLDNYELVSLDSIVDLTKFYKNSDYKIKVKGFKFYYLDSQNYLRESFINSYNKNSNKKIQKKFLFCYRTNEKNKLNLYELEFYILE